MPRRLSAHARAAKRSANFALFACVGLPFAASADSEPALGEPAWINSLRRDPIVSDPSLRVNTFEPKTVDQGSLTGSLKSDTWSLVRRWLSLREEVRSWDIETRSFQDRTLSRYFPNSSFFHLVARSDNMETIGYGCTTLGQELVLPDDINLLLILENRYVTVHNVRQLSELLVRMVDPEGPTTMNVLGHELTRDGRTNDLLQVRLESWSYNSRQKKRWTIDLNGPFFHKLEEKVLSVRPLVLDGLKPLDLEYIDDDEIAGPTTGHERYIAFWRDPTLRNKMKDVRREWVESRTRDRRADEGEER